VVRSLVAQPSGEQAIAMVVIVVRWAPYPSTDLLITEDSVVRRVAHAPSGMTVVTPRVSRDPVAGFFGVRDRG